MHGFLDVCLGFLGACLVSNYVAIDNIKLFFLRDVRSDQGPVQFLRVVSSFFIRMEI
jgi:hypothetical protein